MLLPSSPSSVAAGASQLLPNLTAIANTDGLTTHALVATPTGGTAPYTYAWTVDGATTGIVDATAASTTYPSTTGGRHAARCVVTDALGVVAEQTEEWVVGIVGAHGEFWYVDWELDPSTMEDHDWKSGALTHDGVTLTLDGTATVAGITSGVMTIQPTGPGDVFLWALGNEPSAMLGRDFCWMVAFGANLTANNDGVFVLYGNSGTTVYGFAEARNVSGVQKVDMQRAGLTPQQDSTAGGGQVRILGLRMAGQYGMQCVYSETAIAGGAWPAPSSMSRHDKVPSGWYSLDDSSPADTADTLSAATDRVRVVQCRGTNARSYTITRLARLVRA